MEMVEITSEGKVQTERLMARLGDSVQTVITCHQLRRGLCRAYAIGSPADFQALIVQGIADPSEPVGFGSSAQLLWQVLKTLKGWTCVEVSPEIASELGRLVEQGTGRKVRLYDDIFYLLKQPANVLRDPTVRLLTSEDAALLALAPDELEAGVFGSVEELLAEGVSAGAIVDGRIVSIAQTTAMSSRFADIGTYTLQPFRGRGFSTAATSLVAAGLQERNLTPIWSTGEDNIASQRVAAKVGFELHSRATYVIPED